MLTFFGKRYALIRKTYYL